MAKVKTEHRVTKNNMSSCPFCGRRCFAPDYVGGKKQGCGHFLVARLSRNTWKYNWTYIQSSVK